MNLSLTLGNFAEAEESKDLLYCVDWIGFLSFVKAVGGKADVWIISLVLGSVETVDEEDESVEDADESTESSFLTNFPFVLPMFSLFIIY